MRIEETLTIEESKEVEQELLKNFPNTEKKETESFNIRCIEYLVAGLSVKFHYIGGNKVLYSINEKY